MIATCFFPFTPQGAFYRPPVLYDAVKVLAAQAAKTCTGKAYEGMVGQGQHRLVVGTCLPYIVWWFHYTLDCSPTDSMAA